jgi:hypothetical protein
VYSFSMISVTISAWSLEVNVQSSEDHPDALTDITNRATSAFASALASMKATDVPLYDTEMIEKILEENDEF